MNKRSLFKALFLALFLLITIQLVGCGEATVKQHGIDINVIYEKITESGYTGTADDLIKAFTGDNAYEVVVEKGYTGSKLDWISVIFKGKEKYISTMTVGENGNWYIGNTDTGIKAIDIGEIDKSKGIEKIEKTKSEGNVDIYTIYYTDGSTSTFTVTNGKDGKDGEKGDTGRGIEKIEKTKSEGNVDIYTIYYTDGSTSTFTVTNGVNGNAGKGISKIEASGSEGNKDIYTIYFTDGSTFKFTVTNGVNGKDGEKGDTGNGILKIEEVEDDNPNDNVVTYRIYYTNGDTFDFKIFHGIDGKDGKDGAPGKGILYIEETTNDDNSTTYTFYFTDDTTFTFTVTHGKDGEKGDKGDKGDTGETGNGISKIEKLNSEGLIDNYRIYFTNGETFDFSIINGKNGVDGKDGEKGATGNGIAKIEKLNSEGLVDNYKITFTDGSEFTFKITNGAKGEKGDKGDTGKGILKIEKKEVEENSLIDEYVITFTDGSTFTFYVTNGKDGEKGDKGDKGDPGNGIKKIKKVRSEGNIDYYLIIFDDNSEHEFTVTNGINGKDGLGIDRIELIDKKDNVDTYAIIFTDGTRFTFTVTNGINGKDGEKGEKGETGNGIKDICLLESDEEKRIDTYKITFTDGTSFTFTVKHGVDGEKGEKGDKGDKGDKGEDGRGIKDIIEVGREGNVVKYRIIFTDDTYFEFEITNGVDGKDGERGPQGPKGDPGTGIDRIEKIKSEGNLDYYTIYFTIYFTDGETFTFTIENGEDGKDGKDGKDGEKGDPGIGISEIVWAGRDGNVDRYIIYFTNGLTHEFTITNGTDGQNGKSAYDIYKELYGYDGTLEDWINDLVKGKLGVKTNLTVTLDYNNGQAPVTLTVEYGKKVKPTVPTKAGYNFVGWMYEGQLWDINAHLVTENMTLVAKWEPIKYKVTFDSNGGSPVSPIYITVEDLFVYPEEPTRSGSVFAGWYNGNTLVTEGQWTYTTNVTLTAKWRDIYTAFEYDYVKNESGSIIGVIIKKYHNTYEKVVEIPTKLQNYTVIAIGMDAFKNNPYIERIIVPNTVTTLEEYAFANVPNLKEVVLHSTITSYGANLFAGNSKLETITLFSHFNQELKYLFEDNIDNIPSTLKTIKYVYSGGLIDATMWKNRIANHEITLILDESFTSIPDETFKDATYLTSIVLPNTIIYIGEAAFANSGLRTINLPDSITIISANTFKDCRFLTTIIIPTSVTTIGEYAFANCTDVTAIYMDDSVMTIGEGAFAGCVNVEELRLSRVLESIGAKAFSGLYKIEEIFIPYFVTEIKSETFANWTSLRSITISSNVTTIEADAFKGVTNVTFYVEHTSQPEGWEENWYDATNNLIVWGVTLSYDKTYVVSFTKTNDTPVGVINPTRVGFTFVGWYDETTEKLYQTLDEAPVDTTLVTFWEIQ